jgi:hypothetical protein
MLSLSKHENPFFSTLLGRAAPPDPRQDDLVLNPVPVGNNGVEHAIDQLVREKVGHEPEVQKPGVFGIIIMLFCFHPGVGKVLDPHVEAQPVSLPFNQVSQL